MSDNTVSEGVAQDEMKHFFLLDYQNKHEIDVNEIVVMIDHFGGENEVSKQ